MTMFRKHVIKQLSAYCNGELAPEQSRSVREHLLACERCRKEYEEIKLGVNLAQQLPLVSAPAGLWGEIEALLEEQSRKPRFEPKRPMFSPAFSWYRIAAVSAVLVVATVIGFIWSAYYGPKASWAVNEIVGNVRIDGYRVIDKGSLEIGETLETDSASRAKVTVAMIGEVVLDHNTRVRLTQTRMTEHRLALDHGRIHAKISAPPRLFFVNTPSAEAIDLGCEYTLEVDSAGRGLLHVTNGFVALARGGREVWVPRYGMCQAWPGIGPGTPYFEDASATFVTLLQQFDFENGGDDALTALLRESRERDTFTLWHLLSQVDDRQRVLVLDRMIELVGLPEGITREATLRLDKGVLEAWKEAMDTVWF